MSTTDSPKRRDQYCEKCEQPIGNRPAVEIPGTGGLVRHLKCPEPPARELTADQRIRIEALVIAADRVPHPSGTGLSSTGDAGWLIEYADRLVPYIRDGRLEG